MRQHLICAALALLLPAAIATTASAEVVRFHYTSKQVCGYASTSLKVGTDGSTGQWSASLLSPRKDAYYCQPKATHMVTFRHPCSGQNVTVPIAYPQGTPQVTYQSAAIVYTYTQYTIRVEFVNDGSVDVIYNSGVFRPLEP